MTSDLPYSNSLYHYYQCMIDEKIDWRMIMKEYHSLSDYFRDLNSTSDDPVPVIRIHTFVKK